MKSKKILAFAAAAAIVLMSFGVQIKPALAAIASWEKGVTISPRSDTDYGSATFKQSIDNLAKTHANFVSMIVPYYQTNPYTTDLGPGYNTPTDASLTAGINYIHSKGMKVMLMPHADSQTGEWRANINPSDRAAWFANYGNILTHLAQIAKQTGVEQMSVGSELIKMSTYNANPDNTQQWINLINQVRSVYSGKLTYSANWGAPPGDANEKAHIGFWPQLDYVGISGYYDLNQAPDNSVSSLESAWNNWLNSDIAPFANSVNKPVLFTEVGYRSVSNAHSQPWDFNMGGGADQTEQANAYQALFDFWNKQSFLKGVFLWNWSTDPNAGGAGDTGYTPQNKQAQDVITQWFGGGTTTTSDTSSSDIPAQQTSYTNTGNSCPSPAANTVIGCYYSGQNFDNLVLTRADNAINFDWGSGSPDPVVPSDHFSAIWLGSFNLNAGSYTLTVTADDGVRAYIDNQLIINQWKDQPVSTYSDSGYLSAGTHTIKMEYYENSGGAVAKLDLRPMNAQATSADVGPQTDPQPAPAPAPSGDHSLDVWWPTNNNHLSGVQPFKAVIYDLSLPRYTMYWQVDSGSPVVMQDNYADFPHKEATVDLTSWNWSGNGPYHLNFTARDSSNNLISQRLVDIFIP